MSLYKQLIIIVFSLYLVFLIGASMVLFDGYSDISQSQQEAHVNDIATTLALNANILSGNISALQTTINAIFDSGEVSKIRITNNEGKVVYEREVLESRYSNIVPKYFARLFVFHDVIGEAILNSGWNIVGKVEVFSNHDAPLVRLWVEIKQLIIYVTIFSIFVLLLALYLLNKVVAPLKAVAHQAISICNKEFNTLNIKPWSSEVFYVTKAMNFMVQRMHKIFNEQQLLINTLAAKTSNISKKDTDHIDYDFSSDELRKIFEISGFAYQKKVFKCNDGTIYHNQISLSVPTKKGVIGEKSLLNSAKKVGLLKEVQRKIIDKILNYIVKDDSKDIYSVSLYEETVADPDFLIWFATKLSENTSITKKIHLQVSETIVNSNQVWLKSLLTTSSLYGIKVGIYNIGEGYSALGLLNTLPLDFLKISKIITKDINTNIDSEWAVRGIVQIATVYDLDVLAVSFRESDIDSLKALGVKAIYFKGA